LKLAGVDAKIRDVAELYVELSVEVKIMAGFRERNSWHSEFILGPSKNMVSTFLVACEGFNDAP
jgi:hypothetical protein